MRRLLNVGELLKKEATANQDIEGDGFGLNLIGLKGVRGASAIIDVIKPLIEGDKDVHFFSAGTWNLHSLLLALTEVTGPAVMYCSTYAMCEAAARTITMMIDSGQLKAFHCIVDNRIDTRTAGSLQLLRSIATTFAMAPCHAKATVLCGSQRSVLVLGSANYTENKRIEIGMATTTPEACSFHRDWIVKTIKENKDNA